MLFEQTLHFLKEVSAPQRALDCNEVRILSGFGYNFDDNVCTDVHPASIPMPQCFECTNRVNTTEESNRTIVMRKLFHSPVLCEEHGSVYGHRIYGAERVGCGEK